MQSDFRRSLMARKLRLFVVLLLLLGAAGYLVWSARAENRYAQSGVAEDGNYRLVAQDGSLFRRSSLKGHPYITYFGYASCPDRCPATLARLSRIRARMGWTNEDLPIVFITIDPDRTLRVAVEHVPDPGNRRFAIGDLGGEVAAHPVGRCRVSRQHRQPPLLRFVVETAHQRMELRGRRAVDGFKGNGGAARLHGGDARLAVRGASGQRTGQDDSRDDRQKRNQT